MKVAHLLSLSLISLMALLLLQGCDTAGTPSAVDETPAIAEAPLPSLPAPTAPTGAGRQDAPTGEAGKSAFSFIPPKEFTLPTQQDFGFNPAIGINTSKRHLVVLLKRGATKEQFDAVVQASTCSVGGTVPGAGIFQLDCGAQSSMDQINEIQARLRNLPTVEAVTLDKPLTGQNRAPKPPQQQPSGGAETAWEWEWPPQGSNWGWELAGVPIAWNLNGWILKREQNPETATGKLPIPVGVWDAGFFQHPDLTGITTLAPGESYADINLPSTTCQERNRFGAPNHGAAVAGVIGAKADGFFTDGVTTFAQIFLQKEHRFLGIILPSQTPYTSILETISNLRNLLSSEPRPRVVNISFGYAHWRSTCFPERPARCDPRSSGRIPDGTACVPQAVQLSIAADALIFNAEIEFINAVSPLLLVVAAGNNSGPMLQPGQNYCRDCPDPSCGDTPCPPSGMGFFPAGLNSPLTAVASRNLSAAQHLIVVEALSHVGGTNAQRAFYSNIDGGGTYAPGQMALLERTPTGWGVDVGLGTSFASPFVVGVAAQLLAIQPDLTNEELKKLLTEYPCAERQDGGDSATATRVNDLFATLCIDRLPRFQNQPLRILRHLADMNNPSLDGNKWFELDDTNACTADYLQREEHDGKVDLRDFRVLRDTHIMQRTNRYLHPNCTGNEQRDLNRDGVVRLLPRLEFFPRAGLNLDGLVDDNKTLVIDDELTDVALFMKAYEGDPVQGWRREDLPQLLHSADLWVRPAAGLGNFTIDIEGSVAQGDTVPTNLQPLRDIAVRNNTNELIVSTPLRDRVRVIVRLPNTPEPMQIDVGSLQSGERRVVVIGQRATGWEERWTSHITRILPDARCRPGSISLTTTRTYLYDPDRQTVRWNWNTSRVPELCGQSGVGQQTSSMSTTLHDCRMRREEETNTTNYVEGPSVSTSRVVTGFSCGPTGIPGLGQTALTGFDLKLLCQGDNNVLLQQDGRQYSWTTTSRDTLDTATYQCLRCRSPDVSRYCSCGGPAISGSPNAYEIRCTECRSCFGLSNDYICSFNPNTNIDSRLPNWRVDCRRN